MHLRRLGRKLVETVTCSLVSAPDTETNRGHSMAIHPSVTGDSTPSEVGRNPDVFDLSTLEAGDEVRVDFFVPEEGDDRLEAASKWKL